MIVTNPPSHMTFNSQGHENLPVVPWGESGGWEQAAEGAESEGQGRPADRGTGQEVRQLREEVREGELVLPTSLTLLG